MTRQEMAISNLKYAQKWNEKPADEVIKIAIEALEQEPVLDKIRADVINIADGKRSMSVRSVVKIIDKYKAESEER